MTPWRLPGPFEQTVEVLTKAPRDVHPHEVSSVGNDRDVRGRSDDLGSVCRGCDGDRTGSPVHEHGRHLGTGKSVGQPGELGDSGLKRGTGRCGVDPEIGKLRRSVGGRKICGPEDPQRLHCFRFGSDAVHHSLVQHGSTLHLFWGRATRHLSVEGRKTAITNTAQRVDDERGRHSIVMRREQVKQQVPAPGVAPDYRALPAEMIEYSDHVRDVGRNVKRPCQR